MLPPRAACATSALLLLALYCTSTEKPGSDPAAGVASGLDEAVVEASAVGELTGRARRVVDLTVLLSETLPAHWGSNPPFARWTNNWFEQPTNFYGSPASGSNGPYYSQRFVLDEHTGTQTDFPAHFVPPPDSGLPHASPMGAITGDKYPLNRMMGPAVVIDVTDLRDAAEPGFSAPITVERIQAWESEHGPIQPGEVVLFRSGYSDAYYKPLPEGARMTMEPLVLKTAPGWPAPTPEAVKYLFDRGVWHLGTDGASMGPVEDGQPTHLAGLQHGMSWEELLINLGELPVRGAFYIALPLKVADQSGAPARAIALLPGGGSE